MRQVLSLSLPATKARTLKTLAKKRGFWSVSAYILNLFEADKDLISETELLKTAQEARKEYQEGRSIKAKSMADLI